MIGFNREDSQEASVTDFGPQVISKKCNRLGMEGEDRTWLPLEYRECPNAAEILPGVKVVFTGKTSLREKGLRCIVCHHPDQPGLLLERLMPLHIWMVHV